ncbi:MAG: helix-turn-helix domain-containing protein [Chloroflexota bacterium]
MTRHLKSPLRLLTSEERKILKQVSRASSTPAAQVERAKLLLAVADGMNYTQAAQSVGRRSGDAVSHLVQRFNVEGLGALVQHHGGGFRTQYGEAERARILQEFQRIPDRQRDGTATWSLTTAAGLALCS